MSGTATNTRLTPEIVAVLSALSTDAERRVYLKEQKLLLPEVIEELNALTLQEFRINTKNALSLADAAIVASNAICRLELLAQSYRIKGNVLSERGEYQAAVKAYDEAQRLFENSKDAEGVGRTVTAAIQPHILLGEFDQAFALASKAQDIFKSLGDERRLARLENNIGNIYHRQDRFHEALFHYEHAYKQLLPYGDSEELSISLNNMSMCLITLNDFAKAHATYQRAKNLLQDRDIPLIHLIADYNIAYLYYLRGDYRRAIEGLKKARLAGEQIGDKYLIALCHLDLSDIYVELNLSSEVNEIADQGYRLFRELEIGYETAKALVNRALAFGQQGKTKKSLELFAEARPLFVKEKNEIWPWLIDLYSAIVLFSAGRHYEAKRLALTASGYFDASFMQHKAAICHFLLAQIAAQTDGTSDARQHCQRGLDILKTLDAPILRYQGHFLMGRIDQASGNLSSAYLQYQQARFDLESLRSNLYRDELKISFMKNKTELYEGLVDLCTSLDFSEGSPEEAFKYMELAKSRSLTELMFQRGHAPLPAKIGQSELVHKIRELREELNWYQHRIELEQLRPEKNIPETIEALRAQAQEREKNLLDILEDLPDASLEAAALPSQKYVSIDDIRSALNPDASFVEYYFVGDRILAAVVSKHNLEVIQVAKMANVSESLRFFRFQLGRLQNTAQLAHAAADEMYESTLGHLQQLHSELIDPLLPYVDGNQLVIVPHGSLHYLPFHALHNGSRFLIDEYEVSYAPSGAVFALCRKPPDSMNTQSLILGVPDERAPLIEREVTSLAKTLRNAELFLGPEASHNVLSTKGPASRLIHIATHGVFRPDNPMFSGIALGDGYLHLYELYQMRLNAELLTLSGCATGLNVIAAGDELLGLIRGALYAGARSLLLSLWEVNDISTTSFMTHFYSALQSGKSKGQAASEAAQAIRAEFPHPYYWAPFALVGDREPLRTIGPLVS